MQMTRPARWGFPFVSPRTFASLVLAALAGLIAISPRELRYDEIFHLQLPRLIETVGWKDALLSPANATAGGPLYAAAQLAASPLTGLRPPGIRWINFAFLLSTVLLMSAFCRHRVSNARAILEPLTILAVPFVWPAAGLALTELPALFFFTGFVLTIVFAADRRALPADTVVLLGAAAGLLLGTAILGRQTYVIAFGPLILMGVTHRRLLSLVIPCMVIAVVASGWLFVLWGGVVPPSQQHVNSGLRLEHGIDSLSYFGIATLFLAPLWLLPRRKVEGVAALIGAALASLATHRFSEPPAKTLLVKLFDLQGAQLVGFFIGAAMAGLGILWLIRLVEKGWTRRHDPATLFLVFLLLGLAATPVEISHTFSSRYVVGALSAQAVALSIWGEITLQHVAASVIAGSVLGAMILATYYW
jgi:hypothetical protein